MAKRYLLLMVNKEMPMPTDPKQAEESMKPWKEWMGKLSAEGKFESGTPVNMSGKAVRKRSIKDYAAKNKDIGGYIIIKAESMDEAVKIAQSSPYAKMNMGTTIVRECIDMQM